ncbi:hypothetical protein BDA96_07G082600 [Sorghum bicolor]|uniref:Uncharacterized protein n=2 Tax=Sorghum bicolor TaxID=4558 RepID=A0A921QJ60_SORBI|nr:hypothetical protein BDA96_07G082600 [Sorghum bicolor]KXG24728.1 hypothetical protein SORBI_3007G078700 [Sorghum bicolor]
MVQNSQKLKDKHDTCSKQKQDLASCTTPQIQAFGSYYTGNRSRCHDQAISSSKAVSRCTVAYSNNT